MGKYLFEMVMTISIEIVGDVGFVLYTESDVFHQESVIARFWVDGGNGVQQPCWSDNLFGKTRADGKFICRWGS